MFIDEIQQWVIDIAIPLLPFPYFVISLIISIISAPDFSASIIVAASE
jgi:hypothetical protein